MITVKHHSKKKKKKKDSSTTKLHERIKMGRISCHFNMQSEITMPWCPFTNLKSTFTHNFNDFFFFFPKFASFQNYLWSVHMANNIISCQRKKKIDCSPRYSPIYLPLEIFMLLLNSTSIRNEFYSKLSEMNIKRM